MIEFLCNLWPYLAGGLIAWLAAGWFARKRFKHSDPSGGETVEKIVEKTVDNPEHVSLISKLETENKEISGLRAKLAAFESGSSSGSGSGSTNMVDNPVHLQRIEELETEKYKLENLLKNAPQAAAMTTTKTVDNPEHIKRISELEAEKRELENSLKNNTPQAATSAATKTVDNPEHIKRISELEAQVKTLEQGSKTSSGSAKPQAAMSTSATSAKESSPKTSASKASSGEIDKAAAKAAGFRVKSKDGKADFTVVEGIGPKINDLIHDAGIHTYAELGSTKVETIQKILTDAGPRYSLAKPGTWPAQADFAAENKWDALKAWQDELDGGK